MDECVEEETFDQHLNPQTLELSLCSFNTSISTPSDQHNFESPYFPYQVTQEKIVQSFYHFFISYQNKNIDQIIQSLENLRYFSSQTILCGFNEFFDNNIPLLLVNLLSINSNEINISSKNDIFQHLSPEQFLTDQQKLHEEELAIENDPLNEKVFTDQTDISQDFSNNFEQDPSNQKILNSIEQTNSIDSDLPEQEDISVQFSNNDQLLYTIRFFNEEFSEEESFSNEDQTFSTFSSINQPQPLFESQSNLYQNQRPFKTEAFSQTQTSKEKQISLITSTPKEIKQKVVISLLRFMTELGKSKEQTLFNEIVRYSFHENIINVAQEFSENEIVIFTILSFYKETIHNFSYTHKHIIRRDTFDLFHNIIINSTFSKEIRLMPIEIFRLFIHNKKQIISSIQHDQIIDFLISFFNEKIKNENLWSSFLELIKEMIIDKQSFNRIMTKIESYLLDFLATNRICGVVACSISILNLRFQYTENPIVVFNPPIHFKKLFKYAKNKNDSLSCSSLKMIYSIMNYSPELFFKCLDMNIADILLYKLSNSKMKTRKQVLRILSLIVTKGNIETHKQCIVMDFITAFLEMIEIDKEDFLDLAIPSLITLLEVSFKEPGYLTNWEKFDANDGMTVIENLQTSTIANVCLKAPNLLQSIIEMRNSLHI